MLSIIFIAEENDGKGDNGSEDITMIDVQTYSEAFLNMSPRSVCINNGTFSGKKQNYQSWENSQVRKYHNFQPIGCWTKETELYLSSDLVLITSETLKLAI